MYVSTHSALIAVIHDMTIQVLRSRRTDEDRSSRNSRYMTTTFEAATPPHILDIVEKFRPDRIIVECSYVE